MKLERTGSLWNRNNRNGINNNWERLEGVMNSIQDMVIKGQLTPTQYAALLQELNGLISRGDVSVHDIDKNKGLLDQSFLSPELLKQIAGTAPILSTLADGVVTNAKLAGKAVSPDKTTFFYTSGNLFDGVYRDGLLVRHSNGTELAPTKNYDTWKGKTAVVPIKKNTSYSIVVNAAQSNVFRVGTHHSDVIFQDYPEHAIKLNEVFYASDAGQTISSTTIKTNDTDNFLYVYVSNNGTNAELTINENMIGKEFLPSIDEKEVTPEMTTFFTHGEGNLFNGVYKDGILFYINAHEAPVDRLYLRKNYDDWKGKVAIVPVEPDTTYSAKVHDIPTNDIFRIGLMDDYPSFSDTNDASSMVDAFIANERTYVKEITFTTTSTSKYALIYVSNDGTEPRLMVEKGDQFNNFKSSLYIPSSFIQLPSNIESNKKNDGKFSFGGDFGKYYSHPVITDYFSNPTTITPDEFRYAFQNLIREHPEASNFTVMGREDFNEQLNYYEIKPTEYYKGTYWNQNPGDEGTPVKLPKIVITAGIHGRERNVSYAAYYLFKAILENPNNIEELDILKTNFHIIVIPVASPSGFIDNTYENRSGMNINRDFPPYGEVTQGETKLIKKVLDENKDMDFFIDYHNMQPRHDLIGYSLTDNEFFQNMTLNMYRRVGRHWQQKESSMPQAINHRWAYTVASNEGTVGRYVNDVLGVPSTLIEIPLEYQWGSEGRHGPKNTQMGVDILMNTIFACIRSRQ